MDSTPPADQVCKVTQESYPPTQSPACATRVSEAGSDGAGTMLVVDDDESVRGLTAKMLARMGFEVIQAADGAEAVEVFARHKEEIRWVFSDVRMPRIDGWEMLAEVRKICPGIPVVLASGYDPLSMNVEHYPDQPQAFLCKPYGFEKLQEAIRKALGGKVTC